MRAGRRSAFTLIELMIVITIIGILATISQPSYERYVIKARETALRHQLLETRSALDQYRADRGVFPETLEELAQASYVPRVPIDPMTRRSDWIVIRPVAPEKGGVADVHSSSDLVALDGTPYNEW